MKSHKSDKTMRLRLNRLDLYSGGLKMISTDLLDISNQVEESWIVGWLFLK